MATEHECTEMVRKSEIAHPAGRFISYGALRHVAFAVVERILNESNAPELTLTLTIRREDYVDGRRVFSARGHLDAAHA
jgi:hypothetical protein